MITAQADQSRQHQSSHQMIDANAMIEPLVKWSHHLTKRSQVAETVCKAFKIAMHEPLGACHIELPTDIAAAEAQEALILPLVFPEIPTVDDHNIDIILNELSNAKRPLVIAGGGVIRDKASQELTDFITKSKIPVVTTFMGKGAIPHLSEFSLGTIGLGVREKQDEVAEKADLILSIGYDLGEYHPKNWNSEADSKIIHLSKYPADVYREYGPTYEFHGSISNTLKRLTDLYTSGDKPAWCTQFENDISAKYEEFLSFGSDQKLNVPLVIDQLNKVSDDHTILISDVGVHKMWVAKMYKAIEPHSCYISNNFASMGISLPSAIAASLCRPDHHIISVIGDGGFMMNCQALETARRYGAKMTIVLLVDQDYGLISWKQEREEGESFGTRFGNPDFGQFVGSFGIKTYQPSTISELSTAVRSSVNSDDIEVIIVQVDDEVNKSLLNE